MEELIIGIISLIWIILWIRMFNNIATIAKNSEKIIDIMKYIDAEMRYKK